jgi:phytoene dehydrogenase-like protein
MKKRVIVIGSGVGGLSCAALLAQADFDVTILEKNDYIGGACSSYVKEGFTFDRAVHLLTAGLDGPFGEVLRRLNLNNIQFITNLNEKTALKIYKTSSYMPFNFNVSNIQATLDQMKRMAKPDGIGEKKEQTEKKEEKAPSFGFSMKDFKELGKIMVKMITIRKKQLEQLAEDKVTLSNWLSQYSTNANIYGIFALISAGFYAISPKDASAAEILWGFKRDMTSKLGFQYPIGSLSAIPDAFAEGLKKYGGKIRKNANVSKIIVDDQKVKGVVVGEEEISADLVVSNLDIKQTVLSLVGRSYFEKDYRERIESLKPSLSAMTFKIGFKEPIIKDWALVLPYHLTLHDWEHANQPGDPKSNGFFCPVLSNIDPNLAPKGKQSVIFGTIVPSKVNNWQRWIDIYYEDLCTFFPEIEEKKEVMDISLPKDIIAMTGKPSGPVEGLALTPDQSGKHRPSSIIPIEGLFACGDTAGTDLHGIGTQLAATSGITLADHIIATTKPE